MNESEIFKFYDFTTPARIHVFAAHEKEEGVAIPDEPHEIIESGFEGRGITPGIIAEVCLLPLKS